MAKYIDTHVHFYDEWFGQDYRDEIGRSLSAGVEIMVQPDVDSSERDRMFAISEEYPGTLYTMLGLYPGSVNEDWEKEIEALDDWWDKGPVAIGEIGLDYHYGKETAELQKLAFACQLRMAASRDLPVNIHLREATEDFFKVLDSCPALPPRGCLHAFSGTAETFRRLQKYGEWYVGIGGVLTFKNSRLPEAVAAIPIERILLETDSPYLAPVPFRGQRNSSANIPVIAEALARIKGIDIEQVAEVTTANATKFFNL
ncbi:MAG: TatD family hydrolase [Bacteroidales bacterium]|nr:TatD family hydrolase [Bacteroidales bacterium]